MRAGQKVRVCTTVQPGRGGELGPWGTSVGREVRLELVDR
jgi:hypothetical protein